MSDVDPSESLAAQRLQVRLSSLVKRWLKRESFRWVTPYATNHALSALSAIIKRWMLLQDPGLGNLSVGRLKWEVVVTRGDDGRLSIETLVAVLGEPPSAPPSSDPGLTPAA